MAALNVALEFTVNFEIANSIENWVSALWSNIDVILNEKLLVINGLGEMGASWHSGASWYSLYFANN